MRIGLGRIVAHSDTVAELRIARDTPATFMEMTPDEQVAWATELASRIEAPATDAPAVCLLDSGTTRRHPLIRPVLNPADQQAWDGSPSVEDIAAAWGGHGTEMSGVESIAILSAGNDSPMVAQFVMGAGGLPDVSTRIKMAKTGDVVAVVKAGGKLLANRKSVKVTIGGCGG